MWRALASNMLTILVVGMFLMGGLILWGQSQYKAQGPLETAICLQVKSGSNMTNVSRELEDKGAISSATVFRMAADYTDKSQQLKAGSFLVHEGASMEQIIDEITRSGASTCGTEIEYRIGVTRTQARVRELDPASLNFVEIAAFELGEDEVPDVFAQKLGESDTRFRVSLAEGVTSWQVVEALKSVEVLSGDVQELPAEGMLAPDSYEVTPGGDRNDLLQAMQDKQQLRINAAWEGRQDGLPSGKPRRDVDPGVDHRKGNRSSRRARSGGQRIREPSGPGDEAANGPNRHLWGHQGAGLIRARVAPQRAAPRNALEYLPD